jgi:DNA-binding PadR family transcriptional regulator
MTDDINTRNAGATDAPQDAVTSNIPTSGTSATDTDASAYSDELRGDRSFRRPGPDFRRRGHGRRRRQADESVSDAYRSDRCQSDPDQAGPYEAGPYQEGRAQAMNDEDFRFAGRGRGRGRRGPRRGFFDDDFGFGRGGQRAAKGDIRAAVLMLLAEEPMHGYQIIQELTERSEGVWQPSAGSIYPRLAKLEAEGLVESSERAAKKVYSLTEAGLAAVAEVPEDRRTPWKDVSGTVGQDVHDLWNAFRSTAEALKQVSKNGTAEQVAAAQQVLSDARRNIYRILAEDPA